MEDIAITINSHWLPDDDTQNRHLLQVAAYLSTKCVTLLLVREGLPQSVVAEVGGPAWHWQGIARIHAVGKTPSDTFRKQMLRDLPCLKGATNNKRYSCTKVRTSWDIAGRYCLKTVPETQIAQWIAQDRLITMGIEEEWVRNTARHTAEIKSVIDTHKGSKLGRYLSLCENVPNTCFGITECIMHDARQYKHLLPPVRALATYVNTIKLIRASPEGAEVMIRNTAHEIKMLLEYTDG